MKCHPATGAAVLRVHLDLLRHPRELCRQLNDHGRRLLNQATFEELLIDQDQEMVTRVVGETYTEPVRDLMHAMHAYGRSHLSQSEDTDGLANAGEPDNPDNLADSLLPLFLGGGWSKAAMVELRGFEPLTPSMRTRCATGLRYSPWNAS